MSFSGKRYKRTRHENLEELLNATSLNKDLARILTQSPPIFRYTKTSENSFNFVLEAEGRHMSFDFTLGEETEVERRDGEKIKVLFTMVSENVLHQVVTMRDGRKVYFLREFYENEAKMTVTLDDTDVKGIIYFEVVE